MKRYRDWIIEHEDGTISTVWSPIPKNKKEVKEWLFNSVGCEWGKEYKKALQFIPSKKNWTKRKNRIKFIYE